MKARTEFLKKTKNQEEITPLSTAVENFCDRLSTLCVHYRDLNLSQEEFINGMRCILENKMYGKKFKEINYKFLSLNIHEAQKNAALIKTESSLQLFIMNLKNIFKFCSLFSEIEGDITCSLLSFESSSESEEEFDSEERSTDSLLIRIDEILKTSLNKAAHDGGTYNKNYCNIALLRAANFVIREDKRLSFSLISNPIYKKYYAKDNPYDGSLKEELIFLGNLIGLEFAADCDFVTEIIFNENCTQKLCFSEMLDDYIKDRMAKEEHTTWYGSFFNSATKGQKIDAATALKKVILHNDLSFITEQHVRALTQGKLKGVFKACQAKFPDLLRNMDEITHETRAQNAISLLPR